MTTPPLTDAQLNHLLAFIGYGSLQADVWFVGMEEGGGSDDVLTGGLW